MNWYSAACPVCGGDLHDDLDDKGWLTCFACARTFPDPNSSSPVRGSATTPGMSRRALRSRLAERGVIDQPGESHRH